MQNPAKKEQAGGKEKEQENMLRLINFDLADIYFPMFVIQMNFEIFPLRNRRYKQAVEESKTAREVKEDEDLAIANHDMMREQY